MLSQKRLQTSRSIHSRGTASTSSQMNQRSETGRMPWTGRTLDGFLLLDQCREEFPDEVVSVSLSGLGIKNVVEEDLLFFTNLKRMDMSDNEAPFEAFSCLPALTDLDFQCNALENLQIHGGYQLLEVLNLSYNCLTTVDVEELSKLLRIRELYLANNWIRSLPPGLDNFSRLEVLSLEHNRLSGDENFSFLAQMPRLRHLDLSHNKLKNFPEAAVTLDGKRGSGFYHLLTLNLSYNMISKEHAVVYVSELRSLQKLMLYGNPVAHPAVSSYDQSKLMYDPFPTLTERIEEYEKEIIVEAAYPSTKKRKPHAAMPYDAVEIFKLLPTEAPSKEPFAMKPSEETISRVEEERQQDLVLKPMVKSFDNLDSTFLTGVGIEDILDETVRNLESETDTRRTPLSENLQVTYKGGAQKPNSMKTRAAMNALRYQLEHPLTSHDDSDLYLPRFQKPTKAYEHRRNSYRQDAKTTTDQVDTRNLQNKSQVAPHRRTGTGLEREADRTFDSVTSKVHQLTLLHTYNSSTS